jgi:hypothetical protein
MFFMFYNSVICLMLLYGQTEDQVRSWLTLGGFASGLSRALVVVILLLAVRRGPEHLLGSIVGDLSVEVQRKLSLLLTNVAMFVWILWARLRASRYVLYSQWILLLPLGILLGSICAESDVSLDSLVYVVLIFIGISFCVPERRRLNAAEEADLGEVISSGTSSSNSSLRPSPVKNVIGVFYICTMAVSLASCYAAFFYPHVSKAWGGGKAVGVKLVANGIGIAGLLIDENDNWVSVFRNHKLLRFSVSGVTQLEIVVANNRGQGVVTFYVE